MANVNVMTNSTAGVVIWDPVFEDDIIEDAESTTLITYLAGTMLGRLTDGGNLTAYLSNSEDGSEIPVALLQDDLDINSGSNTPCRPIVAGRVRRTDIVAHGTDSVITDAESDLLRDYGIIPLTTLQIAKLDNG